MSKGCEFYADALVDLAAGTLEEGRAARVEGHLAECADCREALAVIHAVRSAPVAVPTDLEARIRSAVAGADSTPATVTSLAGRSRRAWPWVRWAVPAAAAALAVWLGANALLMDGADGDPTVTEVTAEFEPYGSWPASDGLVAGELVLSELSIEELETLLEEMEEMES